MAVKSPIKKRLTARQKGISELPLGRIFDLNINADASKRPSQPYSQSEWVFIAVNEIIKAVRSIPGVICDANDNIVESGAACDYLFNDDHKPFSEFISETAGFLALDREAYWIFGGVDMMNPESIYVAGRNTVEPIIRGGILVGYRLTLIDGRNIPLLLEDVWPILDFNPVPDYHSVGPSAAARIAISAAYNAAMMNEATLANGGKLSGIITLPPGVALSEPERQAMLAKWESRHAGARRAGKIAIMTGGADFKQLSQSMVDLQMVDLRRFDASAIVTAIGVPPELCGLSSEAQYAHGPAQQRFIVNTVIPLLSFIADHITRGILPKFNNRPKSAVKCADSKSLYISYPSPQRMPSFRKARQAAVASRRKLYFWFASEEHPTIQQMIQEQGERVLKYTQYGITLNTIVKTYDLPFEEVPWGNDWWIQPSLTPARYLLETGPLPPTGPSLPEAPDETQLPAAPGTEEQPAAEPKQNSQSSIVNSKLQDDPKKLRLWHNWIKSWAGIEKEYAAAMRNYFSAQARIVINNLKRELAATGPKSAKADDQMIARITFDVLNDKGKLRAINEVHIERAGQLGIVQTLSELTNLTGQARQAALDAVMRSNAMQSTIRLSSTKLSGVGRVTQQRLASSLAEGLDANEGIKELTERIRNVLGENTARALSIARTQTGSAVSSGRQAGMTYAGVKKKAWITSGDEHVRKLHVEAGARYREGIAVDDFFWVGNDKLKFPGDPNASAANVVNCRCVAVAVEAQKALDGKGFYTYQELLEEFP